MNEHLNESSFNIQSSINSTISNSEKNDTTLFIYTKNIENIRKIFTLLSINSLEI